MNSFRANTGTKTKTGRTQPRRSANRRSHPGTERNTKMDIYISVYPYFYWVFERRFLSGKEIRKKSPR